MNEQKEKVRFLDKGSYTRTDLERIITYFDQEEAVEMRSRKPALQDAVRFMKEKKNVR
jgi:Asp-tRNA(Asn)/Glu-tRNA(Gln) amidotransferase C subunit